MEGKKTRTVANVRDNIVQSNLLIQGRKTLDLLGTRLFILALRTINPHFSEKDKYYDTEFRESFISTTKLVELLGGKNYLSMVDDTCQKILGSTVELGYGSGNSRPLRIFEKLDYEPRRGLRFLFSEDMRPHLLELNKSKGFTMIDSRYLLKLSSPYAVRLLELFLQFQNIIYFKEAMEIRRQLTIRQLRFMLNVPEDAYTNRIDNFKKNVLDIPLREINERTPYKIRYKTIKKGRRVNAIKFFVDTFAVRNDVEKRKRPRFSNDAIDRLHNLGFNEGAARAIFMKCKSVDDCFERIVRAETILTHQRARVTNRLGFLRKAILEDWQVHFAKEGLYYLDYSDKEQLAKLREERKNAPPVEPKKRVRRTPRQIMEDRYRRPTPEEMEAILNNEVDEQELAVLEEIEKLTNGDPFAEVDVEAIRRRVAQKFAKKSKQSADQPVEVDQQPTQLAQPAARQVEQTDSQAVVQSVEQPVAKPVERPVPQAIPQPVTQPVAQPSPQPAEKPVEQQVAKPAKEPLPPIMTVDQFSDYFVTNILGLKDNRPSAQQIKPIHHPLPQPVSQPVVKQPTPPTQPSARQTEQTDSQAVVQSVEQVVPQPVAQPIVQPSLQPLAEPVGKNRKRAKPKDEWEALEFQEEEARANRIRYEQKQQEVDRMRREQRSVGGLSLLADSIPSIVSSWNISQEQKNKLLYRKKKVRSPFEIQTPLYPRYIVLNGKILADGAAYHMFSALFGSQNTFSANARKRLAEFAVTAERFREIYEEYWGAFDEELDVENDGFYQFDDPLLHQPRGYDPEPEHEPGEPPGPRMILVKGNKMIRGTANYIAKIFNINKPAYRNLRNKFLFRYHITPEEFELIYKEYYGEIPEAPDVPDLPRIKSLARPILPEPPHEFNEIPGPRYLLIKGKYKVKRSMIVRNAYKILSDKASLKEIDEECIFAPLHLTLDEFVIVHEAYYGPLPLQLDPYNREYKLPPSPDEIPPTVTVPMVSTTYDIRSQHNASVFGFLTNPTPDANNPPARFIKNPSPDDDDGEVIPWYELGLPAPTDTRNVLIVPKEIPGVPKVYDDKTVFGLNGKALECRFLRNFVKNLETDDPEYVEDCKDILADYGLSKNEFLKLYYTCIKPYLKD